MLAEQRNYIIGCGALCCGALFYMLCDFGQWPMLMYEPYERSFLWAQSPPSAATMLYPGMLLWGLAGWILGAGLTIVITGQLAKRSENTSKQSRQVLLRRLLGLWTLTLVGLVAAYYLWGLWPF